MWFYTATPQERSGCGRTDEMVRATTRRCMGCDGMDMDWLRSLREPPGLPPSVEAVAVEADEQWATLLRPSEV
jgi:hypothetical protein